MSWENLRTNFTDRAWEGYQKYNMISNGDGTVSFVDMTTYTQNENSFYSALDANRTNEAINAIMAALENGTDLYEVFQEFFANQQTLFAEDADYTLRGFSQYITDLEADADADIAALINGYNTEITQFEATQEALFNQWFEYIKGELSDDVAGHLMDICMELDSRLSNLEYMCIQNDFFAPILADEEAVTPTLLVDDVGNAIIADWKYKEV